MKFVFILFLSLCITSCSINQSIGQEKKYNKLTALEKQIVNPDLTINKKKAKKLFQKALKFNKKHPANKHKESIYVLAAKCSDGLNWNTKNIEIIDLLLVEFPQSKNSSNYLYNKGKIYEEKIKDIEKSKTIYRQIIKQYPNTELAKNLVDYLKFISKSDQEQLEFLKHKN